MQIAISPVQIFPAVVTRLVLRGVGFGRGGPLYLVELQSVTPAADGQPEQVETLRALNTSLTADQWNEWPAGDSPELDEGYQLSCVLANLGLTAA